MIYFDIYLFSGILILNSIRGIYQKPTTNFQHHAEEFNMPYNVGNNSRIAAIVATIQNCIVNLYQCKETGKRNKMTKY